MPSSAVLRALRGLLALSLLAGCSRAHESRRDGGASEPDASVVYRECELALAAAHDGDRCEGAFFCSSFSDDLCCSHSVECVRERVGVEDSCTPGCAP